MVKNTKNTKLPAPGNAKVQVRKTGVKNRTSKIEREHAAAVAFARGLLEPYARGEISFREESAAYQNALAHRRDCPEWKGDHWCADCFGGGLTKFTRDFAAELLAKVQ